MGRSTKEAEGKEGEEQEKKSRFFKLPLILFLGLCLRLALFLLPLENLKSGKDGDIPTLLQHRFELVSPLTSYTTREWETETGEQHLLLEYLKLLLQPIKSHLLIWAFYIYLCFHSQCSKRTISPLSLHLYLSNLGMVILLPLLYWWYFCTLSYHFHLKSGTFQPLSFGAWSMSLVP